MTQLSPPLQGLSIGQLASRSGVSVSALRFYESEGLLESTRTSGNQRRYARDALRRVAFVKAAQQVGVPLRTIKDALGALGTHRVPTRGDWARLSAHWRNELDDRIALLEALRDRLTGCIGCGCLSLEHCKLVNPADVAGSAGSGARYLRGPRPASPGA